MLKGWNRWDKKRNGEDFGEVDGAEERRRVREEVQGRKDSDGQRRRLRVSRGLDGGEDRGDTMECGLYG